MPVRLEPIDEHMHALGPESTFNESMYVNGYDAASGMGAWFRIGNRANEGYAEVTVCLYLPGDRVGFMFGRPAISGNDAFDAGGLRIDVVEPFEHLTIGYDGRVLVLDDPLAMSDPRRAFAEHPTERCTASLDITRLGPMFGGEPDEAFERAGEEFARGHYEQLVLVRGRVQVGDEVFELDGAGLRDHSWGPRTWQAPWYYRWLTCAAPAGDHGPGWGFMLSRIARPDGPGLRGGFVFDGGDLHLCDGGEVATQWTGEQHQREVRFALQAGERSWRGTGRVLNLIPLRNRREGKVTRIAEGLTEWRLEDGRVGHGLSEYLDQIVDGAPVGLAE
ncbi:MAG: hypothetical protein HYX34_15930 [Actinobacteria bacterium]|nr:hypothetical protein [Actinomycetota bacterium]